MSAGPRGAAPTVKERPLLLYGGTFDPVHRAHEAMAREALRLVAAERLVWIPAGDPPHRPAPGADAAERLRMLQLAGAEGEGFRLDRRELERAGPSYSVLTLREYRAECGPSRPLVLLLGVDAAAGLGDWHRAEELAGLCHLLVLARPNAHWDPALAGRLGWQAVRQPAAFASAPAGLFLMHEGPLLDLSATAVRRALAEDAPELSVWLHPAVLAHIRERGLYSVTCDASGPRRGAGGAGEPL